MKHLYVFLFLTFPLIALGQIEEKSPVRFDGVYKTTCIEEGEDEVSQYFLRFYADGKVISATTVCKDTTEDLKKWLGVNSESVAIGDYQIKDGELTFTVKDSSGEVQYTGIITDENKLDLKYISLINGYEGREEYSFEQILNMKR